MKQLLRGWKTNVTAAVIGITAAIDYLVTGGITLTQACVDLVAILGLVILGDK